MGGLSAAHVALLRGCYDIARYSLPPIVSKRACRRGFLVVCDCKIFVWMSDGATDSNAYGNGGFLDVRKKGTSRFLMVTFEDKFGTHHKTERGHCPQEKGGDRNHSRTQQLDSEYHLPESNN